VYLCTHLGSTTIEEPIAANVLAATRDAATCRMVSKLVHNLENGQEAVLFVHARASSELESASAAGRASTRPRKRGRSLKACMLVGEDVGVRKYRKLLERTVKHWEVIPDQEYLYSKVQATDEQISGGSFTSECEVATTVGITLGQTPQDSLPILRPFITGWLKLNRLTLSNIAPTVIYSQSTDLRTVSVDYSCLHAKCSISREVCKPLPKPFTITAGSRHQVLELDFPHAASPSRKFKTTLGCITWGKAHLQIGSP
jgi:hypothetical protein